MGPNPSMMYRFDANRRSDLLAAADGRRRATTASVSVVRRNRMANFILSIARAFKVESTTVPSHVALEPVVSTTR